MVNIPVNKNENYIVDVQDMSYEGNGIGKIEGFTVFIPQAIKGEKVEIKIVKINKNFAFGKLIKVIDKSNHRVNPMCEKYLRCGGCQLQHINYDYQLEFKKKRVEDCINRIGKIDTKDVEIYDTLGMENPLRYRNKVQLPVSMENDQSIIGFYAPRSHDVISLDKCYIQDESADKLISIVKFWINKFNITSYNEKLHDGIIRHIMLRKGFRTGEIMVVIVTKGSKLPNKQELIGLIRNQIPEVKSIIQNINNNKTNVILGDKCITLWGNDVITDYIGDFKFNISPLSFFQVNPVQTKKLYDKALEFANLTGNEVVFDAYCGTGTISLFLSQKAKKVYGIEIIEDAIKDANKNAKQNNVDNVEFIVGKSEEVIPNLINKGINPDVVVVDPPRKGCEKWLLEAISKVQPKSIVYVSCDPATLARDLNILQQEGYVVKKVQPVDMFPFTAHVETVALLQK